MVKGRRARLQPISNTDSALSYSAIFERDFDLKFTLDTLHIWVKTLFTDKTEFFPRQLCDDVYQTSPGGRNFERGRMV